MNKFKQELENLIPLSPQLSESEQADLKARVLAKNKPQKSWKLLLVLAATIGLLAACGAVVLGFFDTMTSVNNTSALVEKYSLTLTNPPSVTVEGHTVTIQALIRSEDMVRVIYDISGSKRQNSKYSLFLDSAGDTISRLQILDNGQPTGHHSNALPNSPETGYNLVRQSAEIGQVNESKSYRYFADANLAENTTKISFYVFAKAGGAEVIQLELPPAIPDKIVMLDNVIVNSADSSYNLEEVKITPFGLVLRGKYRGEDYFAKEIGWSKIIKLYDQAGKEILVGRNGDFFTASGGIGSANDPSFELNLGSYDLLDPATITEIEINGVSYSTLP